MFDSCRGHSQSLYPSRFSLLSRPGSSLACSSRVSLGEHGAAAEDSIAPGLIVIGGAATVAAGTGAALFSILADAASSDRAPTTVAAVYTIFDSLAYIGFTAMGLVTAGVAVASFREHAFSRAVGWLSAIGTGLFVVCCGMRKFGRTSQNIRFAGKTELTHPIALRRAF